MESSLAVQIVAGIIHARIPSNAAVVGIRHGVGAWLDVEPDGVLVEQTGRRYQYMVLSALWRHVETSSGVTGVVLRNTYFARCGHLILKTGDKDETFSVSHEHLLWVYPVDSALLGCSLRPN